MITVPRYIESNGPHLSWNRRILTKIFNSICNEKLVYPVSLNILKEYWYATGFYRSNFLTQVKDFTVRKEEQIQTSINIHVSTCEWDSAKKMADNICNYERPGDHFLVLVQDEREKFIIIFSLFIRGENIIDYYSPLIDKYWSELIV